MLYVYYLFSVASLPNSMYAGLIEVPDPPKTVCRDFHGISREQKFLKNSTNGRHNTDMLFVCTFMTQDAKRRSKSTLQAASYSIDFLFEMLGDDSVLQVGALSGGPQPILCLP